MTLSPTHFQISLFFVSSVSKLNVLITKLAFVTAHFKGCGLTLFISSISESNMTNGRPGLVWAELKTVQQCDNHSQTA